MKKPFLWIILGLSWSAVAAGQGAFSPVAGIDPVRRWHLEGVEGNSAAVDQALQILQPLLAGDPENPVYKVYHGSCLALKGRDVLWPMKKLDYARAGFAELDQAVALAPENLEVRFIRAMCGLNVPRFFGRLDQAAEDFDFLMDRVKTLQEKNEDAAMVCLYAAQASLKKGNRVLAQERLRLAIFLDSGTRWKEASEKWLRQL